MVKKTKKEIPIEPIKPVPVEPVKPTEPIKPEPELPEMPKPLATAYIDSSYTHGQPKRILTVEQSESSGFPAATKLPNIRGGICEFCGVVDPKVPSHLQYTLQHAPNCPYTRYGGLKEVKCSYCPEGTDLDDVRAHRVFSVFEFPPNSGKLTVVCDDMRCESAHFKRFQTRRTV